jgi:carbonic anhydrase
MCKLCFSLLSSHTASHEPISKGRRSLMGLLGAMPLAAALGSSAVQAQMTVPLPENVLSPDQALTRLMAGNDRYVTGKSEATNFDTTRAALTKGQNPYACILSCADSRVAPELCFDEGRGDLFVTRVAGNFVTPDILASLEYGTAVLKSPLIMVLGHSRCGAISAAVQAYTENAAFPGHIQALTTALAPAVRQAVNDKATDLVLASERNNILLNVRNLKESNPIISQLVKDGKLKIVGGFYNLSTGRVDLVS